MANADKRAGSKPSNNKHFQRSKYSTKQTPSRASAAKNKIRQALSGPKTASRVTIFSSLVVLIVWSLIIRLGIQGSATQSAEFLRAIGVGNLAVSTISSNVLQLPNSCQQSSSTQCALLSPPLNVVSLSHDRICFKTREQVKQSCSDSSSGCTGNPSAVEIVSTKYIYGEESAELVISLGHLSDGQTKWIAGKSSLSSVNSEKLHVLEFDCNGEGCIPTATVPVSKLLILAGERDMHSFASRASGLHISIHGRINMADNSAQLTLSVHPQSSTLVFSSASDTNKVVDTSCIITSIDVSVDQRSFSFAQLLLTFAEGIVLAIFWALLVQATFHLGFRWGAQNLPQNASAAKRSTGNLALAKGGATSPAHKSASEEDAALQQILVDSSSAASSQSVVPKPGQFRVASPTRSISASSVSPSLAQGPTALKPRRSRSDSTASPPAPQGSNIQRLQTGASTTSAAPNRAMSPISNHFTTPAKHTGQSQVIPPSSEANKHFHRTQNTSKLGKGRNVRSPTMATENEGEGFDLNDFTPIALKSDFPDTSTPPRVQMPQLNLAKAQQVQGRILGWKSSQLANAQADTHLNAQKLREMNAGPQQLEAGIRAPSTGFGQSNPVRKASKKGLSTSAHSDQSSQSGAVSSSIHGSQPIHDTQIDTSQSDDDCATESSMWSDIVDTVTSTFSIFGGSNAQSQNGGPAQSRQKQPKPLPDDDSSSIGSGSQMSVASVVTNSGDVLNWNSEGRAGLSSLCTLLKSKAYLTADEYGIVIRLIRNKDPRLIGLYDAFESRGFADFEEFLLPLKRMAKASKKRSANKSAAGGHLAGRIGQSNALKSSLGVSGLPKELQM